MLQQVADHVAERQDADPHPQYHRNKEQEVLFEVFLQAADGRDQLVIHAEQDSQRAAADAGDDLRHADDRPAEEITQMLHG